MILLLLLVLVALPLGAQSAGIAPTPTIEIGASMSNSNDQLGRVISARRLPDGGIAILDGLPAAVRIFDASGVFARNIGREGQGPGEFTSPLAMELVAEQLHVLDSDGRLTVFALDGRLVRTERLSPEGLLGERFNTRLNDVLPSGDILIRGSERMFGRVRGEYRQQAELAVLGRGGAVRSLGVFAADTGRTDQGAIAVPRPYVPGDQLLTSPHLLGLVVLDPYNQVRLIDRDGRVLSTATLALPRSRTEDSDVAEVRAEFLGPISGANDQRVVSEWVDGMPRASSNPAARRVLSDPDGRIWVELWRRDGAGRAEWRVFDAEGRPHATVLAPPGLGIQQVGESWVLGVWEDDFGVERVRLHTRIR